MRVLILSDSMSLPRDRECAARECYPELVKQAFDELEVIVLAIGKATLPDLYEQYRRYYQHFDADVLVLHCGIVDCAPRALTRLEQSLVGSIPILRSFVRRHRLLLRRCRNISYTKLSVFRSVFHKFRQIRDVPVIAIAIAPPTSNYAAKVPGIRLAVPRYNEVLHDADFFICLDDFTATHIGSDDYHFNSKGHSLVAKKLIDILLGLRS